MNVADQIVGSGFSSTELRNKAIIDEYIGRYLPKLIS